MRLLLALLISLFCVSAAIAADSRDGAAVINEYHNSTVYTGNPNPQIQSEPNRSAEEEGIRVYRDPDTGDRVISVRSKMYQNQNQPQAPMYIYPSVNGW
ncbi:MAG: hypothetical protein IJU76_03230 [Desulfovibrionaceae bacterium]|nr:hypothetical protein [Desulfovibrionaceae bacterium]